MAIELVEVRRDGSVGADGLDSTAKVADPLTVDDLCKLLGISPSTFYEALKQAREAGEAIPEPMWRWGDKRYYYDPDVIKPLFEFRSGRRRNAQAGDGSVSVGRSRRRSRQHPRPPA